MISILIIWIRPIGNHMVGMARNLARSHMVTMTSQRATVVLHPALKRRSLEQILAMSLIVAMMLHPVSMTLHLVSQ